MIRPPDGGNGPFLDREEAGERLAEAVVRAGPYERPVVLALPRGGLPVARPVAEALGAPLDVLVVRKVGVPFQPELAMGAVASGGGVFLRRDLIAALDVTDEEVRSAVERERGVAEERERTYRRAREPEPLAGRSVILVDDGLATGSTMSAAITAVRAAGAREVVVAVPVAPKDTCASMRDEADRMICLVAPGVFYAVGEWYRDFRQIGDAEVTEILDAAARTSTAGLSAAGGQVRGPPAR